MEFKQLDIKPEENWIKRNFWSAHAKRTLLFTGLGAIAGFIFFLITEDKILAEATAGEIVKNIAIGGFFGFFITNSPCARNKC